MAVQIQFRHDTASNWTTANPTLAQGELGLETDTRLYKLGDGQTSWNNLAYGSLIGDIEQEQVIGLLAALDLLAPKADPTFTGSVTAPTFSGALSGNATSATSATTATTAATATSLPPGTSFPSNPAAGHVFFRTDLKQAFIYNGTTWDLFGGAGIETFLLMGA